MIHVRFKVLAVCNLPKPDFGGVTEVSSESKTTGRRPRADPTLQGSRKALDIEMNDKGLRARTRPCPFLREPCGARRAYCLAIRFGAMGDLVKPGCVLGDHVGLIEAAYGIAAGRAA